MLVRLHEFHQHLTLPPMSGIPPGIAPRYSLGDEGVANILNLLLLAVELLQHQAN